MHLDAHRRAKNSNARHARGAPNLLGTLRSRGNVQGVLGEDSRDMQRNDVTEEERIRLQSPIEHGHSRGPADGICGAFSKA